MSIKHLWIIGALLLAGCGGGGHASYGNRDYARNCGNAMDELGMCGGYGPHGF